MKPIFRTDLAMAVLALLSAFTGVQIHYAGHFQSHEVWHNWSVAHFFINVALLIVAIVHVKQHWGFYKTLIKNINLRSKVTMMVTLSFSIVALSGIYLLIFVEGQGSSAGFVHYILGIVFTVFGLGHLAKRWRVFKKGVLK